MTGAAMVKVLVTGPFGAGKSAFVQAAVQSDELTSEAEVTGADGGGGGKASTTVALDYGRLALPADAETGPIELALFGTPGQSRFDVMWDVLATGMDGYIVLVDGSDPGSWAQAVEHLTWFGDRHAVPRVVAANRADPADPGLADRLRDALSLHPSETVVLFGPTTAQTTAGVLVELISSMLAAAA